MISMSLSMFLVRRSSMTGLRTFLHFEHHGREHKRKYTFGIDQLPHIAIRKNIAFFKHPIIVRKT
ncbi:hypothetical protein Bhyg_00662 [Pseudolycoriella hygida]|uniref:Uncharacterized protein n=1 Tax=Pseudolycoriella hygida TaxID=35572 RepID=A0A9Q0N9F9_9DIPT|nr:hypothetical protein Bhyg_00662 [Pseudolycoriella hygida]